MIKVSIIVPVYNVEKYLERCLKSLITQTLKEIEIIVVNDGTKDNSQNIIDKYAMKDSRIKAYIKENGGLSDARNFGLKYATGEYVGFVDSDDFVENDMFEKMYNKAKKNDFDVVLCNLNYIYESKKVFCSSNIQYDLLNPEQIKNKMVYIYPAAWNKIYKKSVIDKFKFKKGIWYEDVEFMYRILPYINSIGVVNEPLYQYVQRDGAITHTFNDKIFDYIDIWNGMLSFYKKNKIFDKYICELEYCYVRYLYATMIKGLTKTNNREKLVNGINLSIKNVKINFPNYKKNKYIRKISIKNIYLKLFDTRFMKSLIIRKVRDK